MQSELVNENLVVERQLLIESGLFDADWYRSTASLDPLADPTEHYLIAGWRAGLEPSAQFDGEFFRPYFESAGFAGPPAVTWFMLRSTGWLTYETRAQAEDAAYRIRGSGLFDNVAYAAAAGIENTCLDPVLHYVLVGESLKIAPSGQFNPAYYLERYPDLDGAPMNLLVHYIVHGRNEGRGAAPQLPLKIGTGFDPAKENVLVALHEMSRTGAPILSWNIAKALSDRYNVVAVPLGDGVLKEYFESTCAAVAGPLSERNSAIGHSLRLLTDKYSFKYAIVNSAECRCLLEACCKQFIPTIYLVHEFAVYTGGEPLHTSIDLATEVVFSAQLVARNAHDNSPDGLWRNLHILPQGATQRPFQSAAMLPEQEQVLEALRKRRERDGVRIVLGSGFVHFRKGVDLFLSTAAAVQRAKPNRPVHFLWAGHGFSPKEDLQYSVYLQEQIIRANLEDSVTFLGDVSNIEAVYALTDIFFLSSRLDPLPNVAIDAAVLGIPVVCFAEASGIADMMLAKSETRSGVVAHLDPEDAACQILSLVNDDFDLEQRRRATSEFAKVFNMDAYIARLDELGTNAAERVNRQKEDAMILVHDPSFDQSMVIWPPTKIESRRDTITRYLAVSETRRRSRRVPAHDNALRRPTTGFNPKVYARETSLGNEVDPFVDFVKRGKPDGPWQLPVITPSDAHDHLTPRTLRVALHAHMYYPELVRDLLARVESNMSGCDLLLSTDTVDKATVLSRACDAYSAGAVSIKIVPNCGRDVGPFLTAFGNDLFNYDVVGHVHGKRSVSTDNEMGDNWRLFLWEHLIGGQHAMMDRVLAAFESDLDLGMIFASDPHLVGWDDNRALGVRLLKRMKYPRPVVDEFDFPLGTMFWARVAALRPLLALNLDWQDYPPEPLPYDGTLLHAIERVLPFVVETAGFSCAVTHVPAITW